MDVYLPNIQFPNIKESSLSLDQSLPSYGNTDLLCDKPIKISGLTFGGTLVVVWIVRGVCLLLLGITISVILQQGKPMIDNFILCGAMWIPLELWRFSVWYREKWFQKTDKGFSIQSHFHRKEYRIEDIQTTSLLIREIQPLFVSGEFGERRLTLFFPNQKIIMQTFLRPDRSDELAPFIELVTEQQWKRAEETLNNGNSISGRNWTLFSDRLMFFSEGFTSCQVQLDEIDAFEGVCNNLLIWKQKNVFPVLRLPFGAENVWLLFKYLSEKTTPKSELPLENYDNTNLGRFIDSFHSTIYVVLFGALTLGLAYLIILSFCTISELWVPIIFFLLGYLLLVVPLGLNGWNAYVNLWEHGFQCIHWFGTRSYFYENIQSVRLNKTVQYVNGFYIGTQRSLAIIDFQGNKVRFFKNDRSANDGALGLLHERITKIVYARFLKQLESGGAVRWTDEIQIMKDGIEIKSSSLFGSRKEPVFIPYEELQIGRDANFSGLFLIWGDGVRNTPIKDMMIEPTIATQLGLRKGRVFISGSIFDFLSGLRLLEHCRIQKTLLENNTTEMLP
jgi:hypothetical protein